MHLCQKLLRSPNCCFHGTASCQSTTPIAYRPARRRVATVMDAALAQSLAGAAEQQQDPIVQYIVLRRDLWTDKGWPLGSVVAQACHASTAATLGNLNDADTQHYVAPENLDSMHKVVLEVKGEPQLRALASKLQEEGVAHKLWVEQPEDFPTCLATKPYRKSAVVQHFKKLQLCRTPLGKGA